MKEDNMDGTCSMHGKKWKMYTIFYFESIMHYQAESQSEQCVTDAWKFERFYF